MAAGTVKFLYLLPEGRASCLRIDLKCIAEIEVDEEVALFVILDEQVYHSLSAKAKVQLIELIQLPLIVRSGKTSLLCVLVWLAHVELSDLGKQEIIFEKAIDRFE